MVEISVVIADQKKATRASYLKQLEPEKGIRVVGEAGGKRELVKALKLKPRILLLDWKIVALKGSPLLPLVRRHSPQTKVILLTSRVNPVRLVQALSQGAQGYVERTLVRNSLVKAVRLVDGGEVWVSRALVPLLVAVLSRLALP